MAIIIIVILVIVCVNMVKSGNNFRDSSQRLCVGMTNRDVINIMGAPSFTKEYPNGSYEYIYEKSEWKGVFRGGTQTRRMECVFSSDNILVSIGKNANCNRSGW